MWNSPSKASRGYGCWPREFVISIEAPIFVYPPGPFPPQGAEQPGTIDLGIRLRDLLYRRSLVEGPVRNAYVNRLSAAASDSHSLMMSLPAIDNLVDTWPLAALIDNARETWSDRPDGESLAVLARCAQVVSGVLGFPQVIDGRWPMPDVEWIEEMTGPGRYIVVGRGPRDGAPGMAVVLNARIGGYESIGLPPLVVVHGDTVVDDLKDVLTAVERGDGIAVRFETPHSYDPATMAALEAIRSAAPAQRAFERYGHAGLLAPDAPTWADMLSAPPAGTFGPILKRTCTVLVLPTLSDDGEVEAFGALVWEAAYTPIRVISTAADILRRLDGEKDIPTIAEEIDVKPDLVSNLLEQLVRLGAATAVE